VLKTSTPQEEEEEEENFKCKAQNLKVPPKISKP
jgi:hypothetical protein